MTPAPALPWDWVLAYLAAGAVVVALDAYVLLGGADFGGGVWDLLATGRRAGRQRALIEHAIGPIWEANHVWLIVVVVLLFTCFPPAFARLTTSLHVPLTLMLAGIVFRGSAFAFRSFDSRGDAVQRRWGRVFAIASVVTPVVLGMVVGAVVSGGVRDVAGRSFADAYVWSWLSPFTVLVGLLVLVLFAFLAAVYLCVEATDEALRDDFRGRALLSAVAIFPIGLGVLIAGFRSAPGLSFALTEGVVAVSVQIATAAAAVTAILALWSRRFRLARFAAAAQASLMLWGWSVAQIPYLLPPDLTVVAAAAPVTTLRLVLIALAIGSLILLPSLGYLFRVFRKVGASDVPTGRAPVGGERARREL